MDRLLEFWPEVPTLTGCKHQKIPGLDAVGCKLCKTWWVNQPMRDRLAPPKGKKKKQVDRYLLEDNDTTQ